MCGINGVIGDSKNNGRIFKDLLKGNEERGRQATGIIWLDKDNKVDWRKAPVIATKFLKDYVEVPDNAKTKFMLGHTRYASSGNPKNNPENHPHIYKEWLVIHNGVIADVDILYRKCRIKRRLDCDSAVIPIIFHKFGFVKGLKMLRGWFAICAVNMNEPDKVYLARNGSNGSPIAVGRLNDGFVMFSSKMNDIEKFNPVEKWYMKNFSWAVYGSDGVQLDKGEFEGWKDNRVKEYVKPEVGNMGVAYQNIIKGFYGVDEDRLFD